MRYYLYIALVFVFTVLLINKPIYALKQNDMKLFKTSYKTKQKQTARNEFFYLMQLNFFKVRCYMCWCWCWLVLV